MGPRVTGPVADRAGHGHARPVRRRDAPVRLPSPSRRSTCPAPPSTSRACTSAPSAPPTCRRLLTVRLTSQPSGVTFAAAGGDCSVAADGLSAVCSTVSGGTGGTVPGAAAAATPSTYTAELPFLIPDGLGDTDLAVAVDVPEGFEVSGGSARTAQAVHLAGRRRPARARLAGRLRRRRVRRGGAPLGDPRGLHRPGAAVDRGPRRRHDHRLADARLRRGRGRPGLPAAGRHRHRRGGRGRPVPGHRGQAAGSARWPATATRPAPTTPRPPPSTPSPGRPTPTWR